MGWLRARRPLYVDITAKGDRERERAAKQCKAFIRSVFSKFMRWLEQPLGRDKDKCMHRCQDKNPVSTADVRQTFDSVNSRVREAGAAQVFNNTCMEVDNSAEIRGSMLAYVR